MDALVIGTDAVEFSLSWPVKDRLPEIEADLRALWSGVQTAGQTGEYATVAGAAYVDADVDAIDDGGGGSFVRPLATYGGGRT